MQNMREYTKITHVAIRFQGETYSLPAPNRHHDVIRHIVATVPGVESVQARDEDQGFLDEAGTYLNRRQALHVAEVMTQILPGKGKFYELYSEDLW